MCLLLCFSGQSKESIAALEVERERRPFGTQPPETQSVPEMGINFLESSSTLHMRAEMLNKNSLNRPTELAILSSGWPLFSWEIRTENWNLT